MIGVIDVGSNSVRLMLKGENVKKFTQISRLSEGLRSSGKLAGPAMDRTLNAILHFVALAKSFGASKIMIFGTEGMRAASNGREFGKEIKSVTGIEVDFLSGEIEALCGFLGACGNNPANSAIIDIGGASTEICKGKSGEISYAKSLQLGSVVLREMFELDKKSMIEHINNMISFYGEIDAEKFFGIGGTFTSLASMLLEQAVYDSAYVDNSIIYLPKLEHLTEKLWETDDITINNNYPTLGFERAQVIRYGASIALGIMKYLNIRQLTVSEKDNLEGYYIYKELTTQKHY